MDINLKVEKFFSGYKTSKYRKGEILVRAGDDPSGIFFLKSGRVREYSISKKGEEVIVNVFKPGAFFPMSWAINRTPNSYFFEAVEDSEVVKAPADDVVSFVKQEHEVLFDLLRRVYFGTDGVLARMAYLMSGTAYERLITEILIYAKRFGTKNKSQITIEASEKDLAALTGMTRETISREIKVLKDRGLISYAKKTLTVNDVKKLEEELA